VPIATTTAEVTITRPETYRLPRPGSSDPHFGFSRSFYYQLEKRGHLKLIHIRDAGKRRGVTLIPYEEVALFVRSQSPNQNGGIEGTVRGPTRETARSERSHSGKSEQGREK
jgi:hypothetical protein